MDILAEKQQTIKTKANSLLSLQGHKLARLVNSVDVSLAIHPYCEPIYRPVTNA